MPRDSKVFEVEQPVSQVYQRWLNFEGLGDMAPQLKEVRKTGERTSHWVAEAMGMRQEWDAETTATEENRRIAWQSTSGLQNSGEVLFEGLGPNTTRVTVNFEYHLFGGKKDAVDDELDDATEEVQDKLEAR
jgi:uncharacterized membrane protein